MYIIGVLSFTEQTIVEVPEIERGLNKLGYAVHLEQMGVNMQSLQIGDYYYEKESVVIWLCRCLGDLARCRKAVASFVQADIDVIVAMTRPALEIALQAVDAETPRIFTHITREPNSVRDLERLQAVRKVTGVWDIWGRMLIVAPSPADHPGVVLRTRLTGFAGFLRANGYGVGGGDATRASKRQGRWAFSMARSCAGA